MALSPDVQIGGCLARPKIRIKHPGQEPQGGNPMGGGVRADEREGRVDHRVLQGQAVMECRLCGMECVCLLYPCLTLTTAPSVSKGSGTTHDHSRANRPPRRRPAPTPGSLHFPGGDSPAVSTVSAAKQERTRLSASSPRLVISPSSFFKQVPRSVPGPAGRDGSRHVMLDGYHTACDGSLSEEPQQNRSDFDIARLFNRASPQDPTVSLSTHAERMLVSRGALTCG